MAHLLEKTMLQEFQNQLKGEEKAQATIEKYVRDVSAFFAYVKEENEIDKYTVIAYKEYLTEHYAAASVNSMLAAVNAFLKMMGWHECTVKALKIQKEAFRARERDLTKAEYFRLLDAAGKKKNQRLYWMMQVLCATGIRVSELRFITAETLASGRTEIRLKGKSRVVLLPRELAQRLRQYAQARGIRSGPLFRTRTGMPLDRSNIWREMKTLCREAGVAPEKVFPHNLRHLFARSFYEQEKDLAHLADILGHSSIETTRIYVAVSTQVHEQMLQRMWLIL